MQKKRILIISHLFYPHPTVAVVRMRQWCRFLPEFGWQPTVLCQCHGNPADPQLLKEQVHPEVTVKYLNAPDSDGRTPSAWFGSLHFSLLSKARIGHWKVPDLTIEYWREVRTKAWQVVEHVNPNVILTTSPPHSIHDLGLWLSTKSKIPWVVDFRDPYLIDKRFQPRGLGWLRRMSHKNYERQIYSSAALVVHAIPVQARWARMTYPFARKRIVTLPNGSPPELLNNELGLPLDKRRARSIGVIGVISNHGAEQLAEAVRILVESGLDLELRLVGKPPKRLEKIEKRLPGRVVAPGPVRHDQALSFTANTDVLVCALDLARAKRMGLSSKLFEYLAVGNTVIVINPTRPDRHLLRNLQGVRVLYRPSVSELATALRWAFEPTSKPPADQVIAFREKYDRRTQTGQLATWLDQLMGVSK